MAAGSRLSWCIMNYFSYLQLFKHTVLNSVSLAGWCPTNLQHLCCKALIQIPRLKTEFLNNLNSIMQFGIVTSDVELFEL